MSVGPPAAEDDRHARPADRRAELELPLLCKSDQHALQLVEPRLYLAAEASGETLPCSLVDARNDRTHAPTVAQS
jgi:hypothetical protein